MNQIDIQDIRSKFPMYDAVSDEDLVKAVHKKFYSEVPLSQFVSRIKFSAPDPTAGMSGTEKFFAGVGKGMTDMGRGVGQMLGMVSRDDVKAARELDAPLMKSGAGQAGNVTGALATALPSMFIPGGQTIGGAALIGAGMGLAQPSESTGETVKNIALGGGLGAGAQLIGRAIPSVYEAGKSLLQPFTKSGQESIAGQTLRNFATNPDKALRNIQNGRELIPGSKPTLAQLADDPGLAQLERTLANNPETGGALAEAYAAQRAARLNAIKDIAGRGEHLEAMKNGRAVFANEDYAKAFQAGIDPQAAQMLQPQIASLLNRPSIKQAQRVAQGLAKEQDMALTNMGSLEGLHWTKIGLDDLISRASNPGSAVGKEQLRALVQTKQDLMSLLDDLSPQYRQAMANYAQASKPINSMEAARELQRKLEPSLARYGATTKEHGNAFATALDAAEESVKRSTGLNKPLREVMDEADYKTLQNIAKDIARKSKADDSARAVGSNTAQNLIAQNMLRRTLGPTGLPQSWGESTLLTNIAAALASPSKIVGAERQVMGLLSDAITDPQRASILLQAAKAQKPGLLSDDVLRLLNVPGNAWLSTAPLQ